MSELNKAMNQVFLRGIRWGAQIRISGGWHWVRDMSGEVCVFTRREAAWVAAERRYPDVAIEYLRTREYCVAKLNGVAHE